MNKTRNILVGGIAALAVFATACGGNSPGASDNSSVTPAGQASASGASGSSASATATVTGCPAGFTCSVVGNQVVLTPVAGSAAQAAPASGATATTGSGNANVGGLRTPVTAAQPQPDPMLGRRDLVCNNVWAGSQCDLSTAPTIGANQWLLAHGDVAGNGDCSVWVWKSGKPSGMSIGTWKLYVLNAPDEAHLNDHVAVEQQIAARGAASGECPVSFR